MEFYENIVSRFILDLSQHGRLLGRFIQEFMYIKGVYFIIVRQYLDMLGK